MNRVSEGLGGERWELWGNREPAELGFFEERQESHCG